MVTVVTPYFSPSIGGLENYVCSLRKLLVQKYGINISIVCYDWNREDYKKRKQLRGQRSIVFPFCSKFHPHR